MAFPKTYRTNAGWALSIGAILALFSNLRNEQRAVISLAILGALGFLWSAWEHEWIRLNHKSIPMVLAIFGLFFVIAWFVWPPKAKNEAAVPKGAIHYILGYGVPEPIRLGDVKILVVKTNGSFFASDSDRFRLAAVAFHNYGKADIPDITGLQKSGLWDGTIDIGIPLDDNFTGALLRGDRKTTYILLLIPNTLRIEQFDTLRQAESMGVKLLDQAVGPP